MDGNRQGIGGYRFAAWESLPLFGGFWIFLLGNGGIVETFFEVFFAHFNGVCEYGERIVSIIGAMISSQ